jgi:hypothetical protein
MKKGHGLDGSGGSETEFGSVRIRLIRAIRGRVITRRTRVISRGPSSRVLSIETRHPHIADDEIGNRLVDAHERLGAAPRRRDIEAFLFKGHRDRAQEPTNR